VIKEFVSESFGQELGLSDTAMDHLQQEADPDREAATKGGSMSGSLSHRKLRITTRHASNRC
jgi:hypothetical protein